MIDKAADAALARYLAATPEEQEPTRESQHALWVAVVRAVIEAMREPTGRAMIDKALEK